MTLTLGEYSMLDISGIKRLQFDVLVIGELSSKIS